MSIKDYVTLSKGGEDQWQNRGRKLREFPWAPTPPFAALCVGTMASGKTTLMATMLRVFNGGGRPLFQEWHHVSGTNDAHDPKIEAIVDEMLRAGVSVKLWSALNDEFYEAVGAKRFGHVPKIVTIDDLSGGSQYTSQSPKFRDFLTRSRHRMTSLWMNAHNFKGWTTQIRENLNVIIYKTLPKPAVMDEICMEANAVFPERAEGHRRAMYWALQRPEAKEYDFVVWDRFKCTGGLLMMNWEQVLLPDYTPVRKHDVTVRPPQLVPVTEYFAQHPPLAKEAPADEQGTPTDEQRRLAVAKRWQEDQNQDRREKSFWQRRQEANRIEDQLLIYNLGRTTRTAFGHSTTLSAANATRARHIQHNRRSRKHQESWE